MNDKLDYPDRAPAASTPAGLLIGLALAAPLMAQAQTNITIGGVIDAGVSYITNQNGSNNTVVDTGIQSPNLFHIRGTEDLGGGNKVVFMLQSQFQLDTGAQVGNLFGRQAWVGVTGDWGTVTVGNQYEFMFESLSATRFGPTIRLVSLHDLHQGPFQALGVDRNGMDFNRVAGATRVQNSIKYVSKPVNGFSGGAMIGLGEQSDRFGRNGTTSAGVNYGNGALMLNAAYTYAKLPTIDNGNGGIRNWGFGGRYTLGKQTYDLLYTNTTNTFTRAEVDVIEGGVATALSATTGLRAYYHHMKGNAELTDNTSHQAGLLLDYALSKRSDVYLNAIYQKVNGGSAARAWITAFAAGSSGDSQAVLRTGLRHSF
ncbi:porin [Massilia niabensis]|uniref:Porin n=1 Tax=Massilia niabensis TaxID=544910 RepID=A0ABW0L2V9_9BURK